MGFSTDLHRRFVEQAAWTKQAQQLFIEKANLNPKSRILEVGSGTGALLTSLNSIKSVEYYGIDIQYDLAAYSQGCEPSFRVACADAYYLPFSDGTFDAVVCHYLFLWLSDVAAALIEMRRVARSDGLIAALAEPDYGSQIQYPDEFAMIGKKQREALLHEGANPDFGRQLATTLVKSGCERVATGILGYFRESPYTQPQIVSEQEILISDIGNKIDEQSLRSVLEADRSSRLNNTRIQFVPTFFGWGYN
jgi:SAM-dependent methyltransferase